MSIASRNARWKRRAALALLILLAGGVANLLITWGTAASDQLGWPSRGQPLEYDGAERWSFATWGMPAWPYLPATDENHVPLNHSAESAWWYTNISTVDATPARPAYDMDGRPHFFYAHVPRLVGMSTLYGFPFRSLGWREDADGQNSAGRVIVQVPGMGRTIKLPVAVLPAGFALNSVAYSILLWVVYAAGRGALAMRRGRRGRNNRCTACGYALDGLGALPPTAPCPECGTPRLAGGVGRE